MARSGEVVSAGVLALWCRQLGTLLELGVPMLAALEVVAEEIAPLAEVTVAVEAEVRGGESLARCVGRRGEIFPPLLRSALLAGEACERVPEALLAVAGCLERAAQLRVARTDRERLAELMERAAPTPAVEAARDILFQAIRRNGREVRVHGDAGGGRAEVELGGAWCVIRKVDADLFGPLCRRLKLMANIPYWIAEPSVGTMHLADEELGQWDVAVRAIPGSDGISQSLHLTLTPRNGETAGRA